MFCFLLVVDGKATNNGKHVYPGSYMVLTPHDPAEVSGDELLTVVVHFMPASCVKSDCPEAPSKLQEVLASKKNADVESNCCNRVTTTDGGNRNSNKGISRSLSCRCLPASTERGRMLVIRGGNRAPRR